MSDHDAYSALVALLNCTSALLFGFVWRAQRASWAGWFALAFALIGVRFLVGPFVPHESGHVPWLAAVLVCPNAVCMTWAMTSYTNLPQHWTRIVKTVSAAVAVILATVILTKGLAASVAMPVYAVFLFGWSLMAW